MPAGEFPFRVNEPTVIVRSAEHDVRVRRTRRNRLLVLRQSQIVAVVNIFIAAVRTTGDMSAERLFLRSGNGAYRPTQAIRSLIRMSQPISKRHRLRDMRQHPARDGPR